MHRILFFEGHAYAIYSYGFLLFIALLVGMGLTMRRAARYGLTHDQALDYMLMVCIAGLVGGRIVAILKDWPYYQAHPLQMLNYRGGGLAFHGAVLGGFLAFLAYTRATGAHRGDLLDMSTPGLIVGHAIGRIGCFLNACCYGRETTVPWAVTYPDAPELGYLPRHPTQLYEAAAEPLVLLILLAWHKRDPVRGGLFFGYMCLYAVERFVVEIFRYEKILPGGLDLAQYASILIFIAGLLALRSARATSSAGAPDPGRAPLPDPQAGTSSSGAAHA